MSKIAIEGNASGTGTFTIASPNSNSSRTLSLPDGTGTFVINGINGALVLGTAQNSTSGTNIDFTGIPSWVKRITVMLSGVSTNGTSSPMLQLGDSGGIETTGYAVTSATISATPGVSAYTTGFTIRSGNSSAALLGHFVLTLLGSNNWVCSGNFGDTGTTTNYVVGGQKTLSDTLDRVRITTVNGTDTFDAGSINILYE